MFLAAQRIRRGMACIAAMLIALQPLMTPHCRCSANSTVAHSSSTAGDSASCCQNHCCHKHTKKLAAVLPRGLSPIEERTPLPLPGGCDCPPTCPCHIQHSPPDIAIPSDSTHIRYAFGEWAAALHRATQSLETDLYRPVGSIAAGAITVSSVSRCALLCRFLV